MNVLRCIRLVNKCKLKCDRNHINRAPEYTQFRSVSVTFNLVKFIYINVDIIRVLENAICEQ